MDTWSRGKKQSQTNPNKAKLKKAKINVFPLLTKDYENISNWAICENEPNQSQTNPMLARHQCGGILNSLMIILLYCIPAYFIRKSRIWKNSK